MMYPVRSLAATSEIQMLCCVFLCGGFGYRSGKHVYLVLSYSTWEPSEPACFVNSCCGTASTDVNRQATLALRSKIISEAVSEAVS